MFGIVHFPFFVAAVFLLNVTPGPDTAYIVGRSVAQGRGAGLMSALGICSGCCVHTIACAFGLTALLAASATAFTVIKFAGAIYLIYLGVRLAFWPSSKSEAATVQTGETPAQASRTLRQLYLQGFWTNVLNPKVVLFFVSFFPQFVSTDSEYKAFAFLSLGGVFIAMSVMWCLFLVWVASSVTQRLGGTPTVKKWLDRVVGSAFVGLGLRLAAVHR
ncbi:lysine transporter LysE [Trinickia dabaoshanensis]|uniref:Lysine transporter LysE n=1 Tax=Trinickia dabaoshanensis TaxID=564714 RepID=A0A2N7VSL9_9BURK|nr:LysE family translocator [Trinickia dabaoshanensis]PMS20154.1 lysine transporter LysE [Trinickia dabaoshanensis]